LGLFGVPMALRAGPPLAHIVWTILAVGVVSAAIAWGLARHAPWARFAAIVLSVLLLSVTAPEAIANVRRGDAGALGPSLVAVIFFAELVRRSSCALRDDE
jgi:hypothetical protein